MGLLICMSDKLSVPSCWLGSTETVLGTSIQREGRGGGGAARWSGARS